MKLFLLIFFFALVASAQNLKLWQLPAAGVLASTDLTLVSSAAGTSSRKLSIAQLDSRYTPAGTVSATSGGTGFSSFTTGDLLYAVSSTALAKLPAGTTGQYLQTNGAAAPSWVNHAQGSLSIQTATSTTKTPAATSQYQALTNNSLTLAPNSVFEVFASGLFTQSGGSALYTFAALGICGSNGADSATNPAALSSVVTVNSVHAIDASCLLSESNFSVGTLISTLMVTGSVIVTTGGSTATIYAVTYANITTPANARITVYLNAIKRY